MVSSTSSVLVGVVTNLVGEPLASATVCVSCTGCDRYLPESEPKCMSTTREGQYSFRALPLGEHLVSAYSDQLGPTTGNGGKPIAIRPGREAPQRVDIRLDDRGEPIAGVVADRMGGPVPHATVQAMYRTADAPLGMLQTTTADEQGRFSLRCAPGHVHLVATAEGYAPGQAGRTAPARDVELTLTPAARLRGRVVTRDGEPVEDVRVLAEAPMMRTQRGVSDSAGVFVIDGLAPAVYQLRALGDRWIGEAQQTFTVDLGDTLEDVVLQVQPAASVSGRLTNIDDSPCAEGRVELGPGEADFTVPMLHTDASVRGDFAFEAVPPGSYQVAVTCYPDVRQPLSTLRVGADDVTGLLLRNKRRSMIVGRVLDSAGAPVRQLSLILRGPTPDAAWPVVPTDDEGRFVFRGLPRGAYTIEADGFIAPTLVQLSEGRDALDVKIVAAAVGQILVRVVDASGRPRSDVTVYTIVPQGSALPAGLPQYYGHPRGDGRFELGPLKEGAHTVFVDDGKNTLVRAGGVGRDISVRSGDVTRVEVTLAAQGGRVTGQVVDEHGEPVANAWVRADPPAVQQDGALQVRRIPGLPTIDQTLSDVDGQFEIEKLEPGAKVTIVAERPLGGETKRENVEVGSSVQLLLASLGSIAGTVVDEAGNPLEAMLVGFKNAKTGQQRVELAQARAGGAWRMDKVTPGPLEVFVIRPSDGRSSATTHTELAPGQHRDGLHLSTRVLPPTIDTAGAVPSSPSKALSSSPDSN